ncbi:MAG: cell division protein FtsB [Symploca sp. SIO2G7]|nr:cell division protein FtsB [Symploca sp. SIO2G7]
MRLIIAVLFVLLVLLQIQLWQQFRHVNDLEALVEQQASENERLATRNDALAAEVADLQSGLDAIEERARSELGLIREGEEFFLVLDAEDLEAARQAQPPINQDEFNQNEPDAAQPDGG